MNFASDNSYAAHPAVLTAMADANSGAVMGYGADPVTARAEAAIRDLLEAPEAVVRFVATGTAANALVCAQMSPSFAERRTSPCSATTASVASNASFTTSIAKSASPSNSKAAKAFRSPASATASSRWKGIELSGLSAFS